MPTDQEIEATRKTSAELEGQLGKLVEEALDPAKTLTPLFAMADREVARFGEVLNAKNAPAGTGTECVVAAIELLGDWCEVEVAAIEGLESVGANKPAGSGPARSSAPRRGGMRV